MNEGFTYVAGHDLNTIRSRIAFMLMMFNAERIVAWRYPGEWEEAMKLLKRRGAKGLADGPAVIVYAPENKFGVYSTREFKTMVEQGANYKFREKMTEAISRNKDIKLEEFLKEFRSG